MKILLSISLFLLALGSFAADITVVKAKGRAAVVRFNGITPEKDQVYQLASEEELLTQKSEPVSITEEASRNMGLFLGASFISYTPKYEIDSETSDGAKTTTMMLSGSFLFNLSYVELGPKLAYQSSKVADVTTATTVIGPDVHFNLMPNRPGQALVPAVRLFAGLSNTKVTLNDESTSLSGYNITPGFLLKTFIGNGTIVFGLNYQITQTKKDDFITKTNAPYFDIALGLYF